MSSSRPRNAKGNLNLSFWLSVAFPISLCWLMLAFLVQTCFAQDYSQAIGTPTFTSAEPVELGLLNVGNGNLHLEIPMASFPQRGATPLTYKLVYDSRIWYVNGGTTWDPNQALFRFVTSADVGTTGSSTWTTTCGSNPVMGDQGENNFFWTSPDGTTHFFNATLQFSNNCGGTVQMCTSACAADGSGYFLIYNAQASCALPGQSLGETIIAPDGSQVQSQAPTANGFKDSNGNYYSTDGSGNLIDTLGRTPVTRTTSCGTNQTCYDVLSSQGGSTRSRWIVTTESIPVHTAFGYPTTNYQGNITVTKSIQLPDGTSYAFTYDQGSTSGHYGEITGITLPTGGTISYGYTVYTDAYGGYQHWVSSHISGGGMTTYTLGSVNTTAHTQNVTVTKPSGDYKVYAFTLQSALTTYGAWKNQVAYYASGGTLLQTVNDSWTTDPYGLKKGSETVTLQTPGGSVTKQTTFAYSTTYRANPTIVKEWNYYTGAPPTNPSRITNITYLSDINSSYNNYGANILNLPTKIQVTDGSGNPLKETDYSYDTTSLMSNTGFQHDDTKFSTSYTTRGNRTQVQQWTGGTSYMTIATMSYDITGKMVSSTDANSNTTSYSYSDCFLSGNPPSTYTPGSSTNAYLTTVTLPASGNTKACYYYNTGKTAWTKDQNSAQTSDFYVAGGSNDPLDRLITETLPTGGWVLNNFSTPTTTVDTYSGIQDATPTTTCSSCRHDQALLDTLARMTDQILVNDPDGPTTVHADYDTNGRVFDTSHPYRFTTDSTYGFETRSYDGLNRAIQVTHQDGTSSKVYYGATVAGAGGKSVQLCPSGTCNVGYPTLTVGESGKLRQVWTDGFGKVVEVDEPTGSATVGTWGSSPTVTYYLYDLLGNLAQATVTNAANGECNRVYGYDTLSRMTHSTEPEPGSGACSNTTAHTTNYYYTTSGGAMCSGNPSLVCRKTDPRAVTITYTFDALNRPTGMTYSNSTPTVVYSYDQTSYNGLAITNGLGHRTGMSDGSGTTAWSFDANGNILTEKRTIGTVTKSISYTYNRDNSLATLTYPSGRVITYTVGNAERHTKAVDSNGTQYAIAPSSGAMYAPTGALAVALYGKAGTFGGITETRTYNNRLQLTGVSATSTGGTPLSLAAGYNSNGEVSTITNSLDTGRSQTFTYDSLGRITAGSSQATSGADCWGQTFSIDNVGNLAGITVSKCTAGSLSAALNGNNQFTTGYSYDPAGNLTGDGLYTYTYNAESELTSANGVTYAYDGNHMRVKKSGGTLYWRTTSGSVIAETNLSGADVSEYVFFAGRRVSRIDSSGNVFYYQADQIGSTRTVTNAAGVICYDADFSPYGGEIVHTNTCPQNYKFAGYERDSETGLDYAINRYYNSRMGRFMSPDPSGMSAASLNNPQSLNRYAYVLNNPLSKVDLLGLFCVWDNGSYDSNDDPLTGNSDGCVGLGGTWFNGDPSIWDPSAGDWSDQASGEFATWAQGINPNGVGDDWMADGGSASVNGGSAPQVNTVTSNLSGNLVGGCPAQPLAGNPPITTQFGATDASHPQPHLGRDYAVPVGTPVFAPYSGSVGFAGSAGTFGDLVVITNPSWNVYLGHLSSISVATGNQVNAGDQVGLSGNTGHSTGPHLHFEQHTAGPIWQNGHAPRATAVDPCN